MVCSGRRLFISRICTSMALKASMTEAVETVPSISRSTVTGPDSKCSSEICGIVSPRDAEPLLPESIRPVDHLPRCHVQPIHHAQLLGAGHELPPCPICRGVRPARCRRPAVLLAQGAVEREHGPHAAVRPQAQACVYLRPSLGLERRRAEEVLQVALVTVLGREHVKRYVTVGP